MAGLDGIRTRSEKVLTLAQPDRQGSEWGATQPCRQHGKRAEESVNFATFRLTVKKQCHRIGGSRIFRGEGGDFGNPS